MLESRRDFSEGRLSLSDEEEGPTSAREVGRHPTKWKAGPPQCNTVREKASEREERGARGLAKRVDSSSSSRRPSLYSYGRESSDDDMGVPPV